MDYKQTFWKKKNIFNTYSDYLVRLIKVKLGLGVIDSYTVTLLFINHWDGKPIPPKLIFTLQKLKRQTETYYKFIDL